MTGYLDWRPEILTHARAAAAAVDAKWTNVAVGVRNPDGKCVRIYYGGEVAPPNMGDDPRVLNGLMVGERVYIVAFWPLTSIGTSEYAKVDDEMYAWKHQLRTRLQADSQLNGKSADLDLEYAQPDIDTFSNQRFALLASELTVSYTEYPIGA